MCRTVFLIIPTSILTKMNIENIKLHNFRIYKGSQSLPFSFREGRNVFVVAGHNGYGKTTLLTSLVWCLYGKFMQEVDHIFKQQILEAGGYTKYLLASLNNLSFAEGERQFSVQITFSGVDIPGISFSNIDVVRTYTYGDKTDGVVILVEGQENELVKDMGTEIFIQDFILPKEIAKFFFFDAEKIVSLAEMRSIQDKRKLSRAYSEVLGINKYEKLKNNLSDMRVRFRKDSASVEEKQEFTYLAGIIESMEKQNALDESKIMSLQDEKFECQTKADELQEKLIRQGSTLSVREIKMLRERKVEVEIVREDIKVEFRGLMELAPFAITINLLEEVLDQSRKELMQKKKMVGQELLGAKLDGVVAEFTKLKMAIPVPAPDGIHDFYQAGLSELLDKYFPADDRIISKDIDVLHGFSEEDVLALQVMISRLRTTYKSQLKEIKVKIKHNRQDIREVSSKLRNAEGKENDALVQKYRKERGMFELRIQEIDEVVQQLSKQIGIRSAKIAAKTKGYEALAKKIEVEEKHKEKDVLVGRLISQLDKFLVRIKAEKRKSMEQNILAGLQSLMHKKGFVEEVKVSLVADIVDISLYNERQEEIEKSSLSKGEQQLYATAILKSLVAESNVNFPVFIDSPMQKLDVAHSQNIIMDFYPTISRQVVILPLLNKEMTRKEYDLLREHVCQGHAILSKNGYSSFSEVPLDELFEG